MATTLFLINDTLNIKSDYGMDLINKVDSFYNSAWNKLTLVGTISFAIIGLLVPFVIQWYQKKSLRVSEELLKSEMANQALILRAEILEDIHLKLEERINDFEKKIKELKASMTGKTFHLQGNSQLHQKFYADALADYIIAAQNYLVGNDHTNLQTVISTIRDQCLPELSDEEINDLKISHECNLNTLLDDIKKHDEKGAFSIMIGEIKLAISKLPKTIKEKNR